MKSSVKTEFSNYQLSTEVLETLKLLGYLNPTPIQEKVIPMALNGFDIVAKSQTGTGKTAAFAIPICELVEWGENSPQALVLEPTRELAVQVQNEIFYIGRKKRLKVPAVFGGFPIEKQIQTLKQKSHIVVGTPGRVMDHIRRDSLKLRKIKYLIIDEADLMLSMGFLEEVSEIIAALPAQKNILLFSATIGERVQYLAREYMPEAVTITIESETETVKDIVQQIYETSQDEKYDLLYRLLIHENPQKSMIFCGTREMVNVLYRKLQKDRVSCGMIHGELEQGERLKTIDRFREGQFNFLIATDVAARGVDFDDITHVINYDFPTGRESFVHRTGRTGRNGKSGKAISLLCEDEQKMRQMVETYIGCDLPTVSEVAFDQQKKKIFLAAQQKKRVVHQGRAFALNQNITRLSIGGGKKSKMRAVDIVGCICNIEEMTAEDIGIIDIRDSLSYVEILNGKGPKVLDLLQHKPIKGKIRKVRVTRGQRK